MFVEKKQPPADPKAARVAAAGIVDDEVARGTVGDSTFGDAAAEKLELARGAVGRAGHAIGECSADINPEFPPRSRHGGSIYATAG
jgi:hypothetical protein